MALSNADKDGGPESTGQDDKHKSGERLPTKRRASDRGSSPDRHAECEDGDQYDYGRGQRFSTRHAIQRSPGAVGVKDAAPAP
ncbi:hypothetical protein GCM10012289_14840 [Nonomuraea cavernae]|uniref:Uncharacterized protein n=1 Tax=Nonomuraea cavernae TaxID=2045107 RepID=A0A917YTZ3_9ACTN|nr:hypothetical protein GCM10012289_14840 [Nonomuraea cavernae]